MNVFKKLKELWQSLTEADRSARLSQEIIDAIDNMADESQNTAAEKREKEYRRIRMRDEGNMALAYPFRRLRDHGSGDSAVMMEQMLETCYMLPKSCIKNVYFVENQGGRLVAVPCRDVSNERIFSRFQIPDKEDRVNKVAAFAVEFIKDRGAKRNIIGVMHAQGLKHNDGASYVGLKVSTMRQNAYRGYDAEALQFAFETGSDQKLVRELARTRIKAMSKDLEGLSLNADERASLGYCDEQTLVEEAINLLPDSRRHLDGVEMLQKGYNTLSARMLRDELDMRGRQLFYSVTHSLGTLYYHKGLYSKALYYLEQARFEGAPVNDPDEAMWRECQSQNHIPLPGSCHLEKSHTAQRNIMGLTRMTMMVNACLGLGAQELDHLLIVRNGDISQPATIIGHANILDVDLLDIARQCNAFIGYLSYGHDRIAIMAAEVREDKLVVDWTVPQGTESSRFEPIYFTFRFTLRPLVGIEQFRRMRDEASRKAIDNERLDRDELSLLGRCEGAHFNFRRANQAFALDCYGDTLFYLLKAFDQFTAISEERALDHFDLDALLNVCYKLGFIFADYKLYDMALSYLAKLKTAPQASDIIETVNCLCNANDFRAYPFILRGIHDLEKQYLEDGRKGIDLKMYSFLRRRLCYILINKGRIAEARRRLCALANDTDPENRRFAMQELRFLETNYPADNVLC